MDIPVQKIRIDKIKIRKPKSDERSLNKKMASALAESIAISGQLHPVVLRAHPKLPDMYEQVAGLHRIYAVGTILGREEIDAYVVDIDDRGLDMVRIGENAFRSPLTKEQFYASISTWKKHYEAVIAEKKAADPSAAAEPAEAAEDDNPLAQFDSASSSTEAESTEAGTPAEGASDVPVPPPPGVANPLTSPPEAARVDVGATPGAGDLPAATEVPGASVAAGKTKKEKGAAKKPEPLSFRSMIQTVLGNSHGAAVELVRIADALDKLSEDDRKVVFPDAVADHAKRNTLLAIANLPAELRPMAISLHAAGMPWSEAISIQVKKTKEAKAADPNAPKSEDDLSDEDWLTTHCPTPLSKLKKKDVFKSDAIAYRRWAKKRRKLQKEANQMLLEWKADKAMKPGPYQTAITRAFRIVHPQDWMVCGTCGGSGVRKESNDACGGCQGAGYKCPIESV